MKQRPIDVIFWENIQRFVEEKDVTTSQAEKECEVIIGYFKKSEDKQSVPTKKLLMRMAEYFEREYIEFFEDWGDLVEK